MDTCSHFSRAYTQEQNGRWLVESLCASLLRKYQKVFQMGLPAGIPPVVDAAPGLCASSRVGSGVPGAFHLHFPSARWGRASFPGLPWRNVHSYPVRVLKLGCRFTVEVENSLDVLDANPLSNTWLENVFIHSGGCLFNPCLFFGVC